MNRSIKHFQKLLDEFDTAAQNHGWQADQGTGSAVKNAENYYMKTKEKLENYIIRKLKKREE